MAAETSIKKIGLIAGGGQFPLLFANSVKKQGYTVVAIAHEGETLPELENTVDSLYWVKLGQLGKIIKYFHNEDIAETVLLGSISKTNIFRDVRPDIKGLSLWNKISSRQDDSILRAVAAELGKNNIQVVASTLYLDNLLFPKGLVAGKKLKPKYMEDVSFGWQIARAIGELDIGQCVVVRNRSVLAVEAIDGTDATIRRGGQLAREEAVIVKVKKPNQDPRFDLPAIGVTTIESMVSVKARVLAVEANQSLLFDHDKVVDAANQAGIIIVGLEEQVDGTLSYK
jgi:DUF1009 family protein